MGMATIRPEAVVKRASPIPFAILGRIGAFAGDNVKGLDHTGNGTEKTEHRAYGGHGAQLTKMLAQNSDLQTAGGLNSTLHFGDTVVVL